MWIKEIVIILFGLAGGCVVAGGVFTVFTAVGLIPRFAEQTGSADHILLYENMLILGTLAGLITTVYYDSIAAPVQNSISHGKVSFGLFLTILQYCILSLYGFFTGNYVGCLALSIAEIADALPIMARRFSMKRGIGIALLALAVGKLAGSLYYYFHALFETA
jgi:stage V sporulation protein AB